jgi:hypothetical protein
MSELISDRLNDGGIYRGCQKTIHILRKEKTVLKL